MVRYISDCIGVMYNGKLVELVDLNELYNNFIYLYIKLLFFVIFVFDFRYVKLRNRIEYNFNGYDCLNEKLLSWIEVLDGYFVYFFKLDINKY